MRKAPFENFLKYSALAFIFTALATPLILTEQLLDFSSLPKILLFKTAVTGAALCYAGLVVLNKTYLPRGGAIAYAGAAYGASLGISTLLGVNPFRGFWGSIDEVFGFATYGMYALFFVVVSSVVQTEKMWLIFIRSLVYVSGVIALAAFLQKAGAIELENVGGVRVTGTLSNPDYYGIYLLLAIGFSGALIAWEKGKIWKPLSVGCFIMNLLALALAQSRAAWIGFAIGLCVFCTFFMIKGLRDKPNVRKRALFAALGVAIFLFGMNVLLFGALKETIFAKRYVTVFDIQNTLETSGRIGAWKIALKGISQKPLMGYGPLSFPYVFEENASIEALAYIPSRQIFTQPHNMVLGVLVTAGLVGLIAYGALYFATIILLLKSEKTWGAIILSSSLIAYFIAGLSLFDTPSAFLLFVILLAYVHARDESPRNAQKKAPNALAFVFMFVAVCALYIWFNTTLPAIAASRSVFAGAQLERKDHLKAVALYKKAISDGGVFAHDLYLLTSDRLLSLVVNHESEKKYALLDAFAQWDNYFMQTDSRPDINPLKPYEMRIKFHETAYLLSDSQEDLEQMRRIVGEALKKFPSRQRFYLFKGRERIYSGAYDEADILFKEALKMERQTELFYYIDFFKKAGMAYMLADKKDRAIPYYVKASRLIYRARVQGAPDEPVVEQDSDVPEDLQFMVRTILLLSEDDQYAKAREIMEKSIIAFPDFESELRPQYKKLPFMNEGLQ